MPKRAAQKEVAPRIRASFLRVIGDGDLCQLDKYMKESLEKDFTGTLNAISKFIPKEHLIMGDDENPVVISHQPLSEEAWQQKHESSGPPKLVRSTP